MKWFIKVLRHYADFSGRARRKEYWMFALFNVLFSWVWTFLAVLVVMGADRDIGKALLDISLSYFTVMALPGLAVTVRRLHDTGKSGWMLLVGLIPLIGGIWLLVLMVTQGQESGNRYGEDPKASTDTFGERERLKSAGVTLAVAASVMIVSFMANAFFLRYIGGFWHFGQFISLTAYIMLLAAGVFLLSGTMTREVRGKTRSVMPLLLVASAIFILLNMTNILSRGQTGWIGFLSDLSVALFAACNLYAPRNKGLIRNAAVVVIVLSSLSFLWSFYSKMYNGITIDHWSKVLFSLTQFTSIAYIVLAAAFYPSKTERRDTGVTENHTDTKPPEPAEIADIPEPSGITKGFTLINLEKIRINTKASDVLAILGEPDFKMPAEAAFAMLGSAPASEKGKEYWKYETPYGNFQVAVKDNLYVVASNGLEYVVEKMKAELPEEKRDTTDIEEESKEDVRFSIASFQPVVTAHGFAKEEAYHMLENYLSSNKPQQMSDDETELLKPLFMNLLMYFRHEAYLYSQTGRGFGGLCDACNASIDKDDFYLMGSWARCRKCVLEAIVSDLDWNYYLAHITRAIGQVPAQFVSQAYDIKDRITKRRNRVK